MKKKKKNSVFSSYLNKDRTQRWICQDKYKCKIEDTPNKYYVYIYPKKKINPLLLYLRKEGIFISTDFANWGTIIYVYLHPVFALKGTILFCVCVYIFFLYRRGLLYAYTLCVHRKYLGFFFRDNRN